MSWLIYALIGITIWSATAVADRLFLIRHLTSKRFCVVVAAIVQCAAALIFSIPFSVPHTSPIAIAAAIASGVVEAAVLYYFYTAVSKDELSRVFPLTTTGPIVTLMLGWILFGETLVAQQLMAFGLFLVGGSLLAVRFEGGRAWASKAIKPLLIGSLLSSILTNFLHFAFVSSDFWTVFFYSRVGLLIGGLVMLLAYRSEIVGQWSVHICASA